MHPHTEYNKMIETQVNMNAMPKPYRNDGYGETLKEMDTFYLLSTMLPFSDNYRNGNYIQDNIILSRDDIIEIVDGSIVLNGTPIEFNKKRGLLLYLHDIMRTNYASLRQICDREKNKYFNRNAPNVLNENEKWRNLNEDYKDSIARELANLTYLSGKRLEDVFEQI